MYSHIAPTAPPLPGESVAVLVTAGLVTFGTLLLAVLPPGRPPRLGNPKQRTPVQRQNREVFIAQLTRLLVLVVRKHREIDVRDRILIVKLLKQSLRLEDGQLERIRRRLPREAAGVPKEDELLADFRARFAPASRLLAAELCCRLAGATWPLSEARLGRTRRVVAALGLEPLQRCNLETRYGLRAEQTRAHQTSQQDEEARGEQARQEQARREQARQEASCRRRRALLTPEDEQAFAALGLPSDAGFAAARKAYRKLAHQYHPDTVAHLGEAHRSIATEKMQVLNAAYSRLERKFGQEIADSGAD